VAVDFAQLAQSLKDNEAFDKALTNIRNAALEHLAEMPHDDAHGFYAAQATVRVVDNIRSDLEAFIRNGAPKPKPGIA
jgi:hypothetical protein